MTEDVLLNCLLLQLFASMYKLILFTKCNADFDSLDNDKFSGSGSKTSDKFIGS